MNKLIFILLISIYFLDYLAIGLRLLPRSATWLPELLSLLAAVLVVMRPGGGNRAIDGKYLIFISVFVLHILVGMVINTVPEGAIIVGFRTYLKYIPFFLIPAVYEFSESQIKKQIKFILAIFLLQVPLAVYQRFVQFRGVLSGDVVEGTVNSPSLLTVIMVSAITITVAFYLKKRISLKQAIFLILVFFIPTTLNETKSTLVLLPLALMFPIFIYRGQKMGIKKMIPVMILGVVTMVVFFGVYDYFMVQRWGYGLLDFLTMEGRLENYLYKGVEADQRFERMGKIDSYVLAFKVLSENGLSLMFGLGAGNVGASFIGGLSGEYAETYGMLGVGVTALSYILWELGVIGVILHMWLLLMVYRDSRALSRYDGLSSALALGWASVILIVGISIGYKNFFYENVMGYMFWYFSGYVVAQKIRMKRRMRAASQNPP